MVNTTTCWCNEMATSSSRCTCDPNASSKNNLNKLSSKLQVFKCRLHSLLPGLRHHKHLLNEEVTSGSDSVREKETELDNTSQPTVPSSNTALDNDEHHAQTSVPTSDTPLDNAAPHTCVQPSPPAEMDNAAPQVAIHSSLHRDHRIWTELNIVDSISSGSFTTLVGDQMDSGSDVIPYSDPSEDGHPVWEDLFDKDVTNGEEDGLTSGDFSPFMSQYSRLGRSFCPGSPRLSKEEIKEALKVDQTQLQEFWDAVKTSSTTSHI